MMVEETSPNTGILSRFLNIRRGSVSLLIIMVLVFFSFFAELIINSRALVVVYQGKWYFPTYDSVIPGKKFGLSYAYETNYRELKTKFDSEADENWVLLPLVPFNPYEINTYHGTYPPHAPNFEKSHYLGTDKSGRDVLARLVYGFRIAIVFSLILLISTYVIGVTVGCLMGYYSGWFDIIFQRLIEVWSNVPFIYVIMIVASVITPNLSILIILMVVFGWMGITWYMRTAVYKEVSRDYVLASRTLGASSFRIIFIHILPNTISIVVTFIPFSVAAGITSLTALDYLGFGLPPPTPSWGELLKQGTETFRESPWIVSSVVGCLLAILLMVTFIGESVREAFDPRQLTLYE